MIQFIRKSFRRELLFCFIIVALLPLFLCNAFMVRSFQIKIQKDYTKEANLQLAELESVFQTFFEQMNEVSSQLCTSDNVIETLYVKDTEQRKGTYLELYTATSAYREYAQFSLYSIGGICKYSTNNAIVGTRMPTYWGLLKGARAAKGELVYRSEKNYDTQIQETTLQCGRVIMDTQGNCIGYLVINLEDTNFKALLETNDFSMDSIMVIDQYWHVIYSSNENVRDTIAPKLRERLLDGENISIMDNESRYYVTKLESSGLYVILGQREIFTSGITQTMYSICIIMTLVSLVFCMIVAWIMSHNLTKPIHDLANAMHEVEKGDLDIRITSERKDEFSGLFSNFNTMTREMSDYVIEQVHQQKELNEANIARMQAQLNPHFLYNTLDTMKWVAKANHIPEIATLSSSLAKILRISISEDQFICLKEEMSLVKCYVDIQRIRFSEKFEYEADVSEELDQCIIPKLILQPLVENAIIHGLSDRDSGHIRIHGFTDQNQMIITVSDDGCGIAPQILERLNSHTRNRLEGHLGFYNVDTIIRLHYGNIYGLSIQSEEGKGTTVTVKLPIQIDSNSTKC